MPDGDESNAQQHDAAIEQLGAKLAKVAGGGDVGALKEIVQEFYRDAVDLRAKNREVNKELTTLRGRVKDGDVILSGPDAKAWGEFQKLNLPVADLSKRLLDGTAATQQLTLLARDRVADDAAKAAGYHAGTLRAVVRLHNLNIQMQDVLDPSGASDEQGRKKKVRLPVVIPEGEDAEPVALQDYVDEYLGDFRDALAGSEAERKHGTRETPTPQLPRIPRQRSGNEGPSLREDAAEHITTSIREKFPTPSELRKQQATPAGV